MDDAVGSVDTREVAAFRLAGLENVVLGSIRGIEGASDTVVNMLAVFSRVGTGRIAGL